MEELPNLEKVRGRVEAPAKPAGFDLSLLLIGGRNPYGEPNLKVSWGWDLRTTRYGKTDALKYPGPFLDRWILERWMPPSFFGSLKQWETHRYHRAPDGTKVDLLGDFPRRGQYGMVMPIMAPFGEFIPLDGQVLEAIDRMQKESDLRVMNVYSDAKRMAQLQERNAVEEAEMERQREQAAEAHGEYVRAHEFEINQNKEFSLPSLWTPQGEHTIH